MADILIKNMEMPSCCGFCRFYRKQKDGINYCHAQRTAISGGIEVLDKLRKGCPLVALPEHGRLIDGDKLLSIFRQANKDCYQIGKYERASQWYDAEGFVEMQKTIVEASNGTDN